MKVFNPPRLSLLVIIVSLGTMGFAKSSRAEAERFELSAEHIAAVNRNRRIVVNYDALATLFGYKGNDDLEDLKRFMLGILDMPGNQIDSVGWCWSEGNEAPYPSKVLPTLLDHPIFKRVPEGLDIVRMCCDETRRRGKESMFSMRINGGDHDRLYLEGRLPKLRAKWENKDWMINWNLDPNGPPEYISPYHKSAFFNFAAQGVRDYKVKVLREIAENYDFDGIEIDFARNSPIFQPGYQWENRDKLTDFMRSVRTAFLEVAQNRGRPLLLGVRVPENLVGCHFDGLDVETWARDQIVDIFAIGCRSMDVDLPAFRRITTGTSIKLYPSLDFVHYSDSYDPGDTAANGVKVAYGAFANWWHQQPDGVYTFNFTYPGQRWAMYRDIGSQETLRYTDKMFVVQRRGGGHSPILTPYPNDWSTPRLAYANTNMLGHLPVSLDNAAKADNLLIVYVADDVNAASDRLQSVKLRVALSKPAKIETRLNGALLASPKMEGEWSEFPTQPRNFSVGENLVSIRFTQPRPNAEDDVLIEKVEVHVAYRR